MPDAAQVLIDRTAMILPHVKITELLLEVDGWTGFTPITGLAVRFAWDENKNRVNQRKHGVSFETAKLVFDDRCNLTRLERIENGEER